MQNTKYKIFDISLPLTNDTIVYPGNPAVSISFQQSLPQDSANVSEISLGSHTGTHVDAPYHVNNKWKKMHEIPLDCFIGPCRVIDATGCTEAVHIRDLVRDRGIMSGERILAKTNNSIRGFDEWYDDYVYLDGGAAEFLAGKDIALFGIDYLSVKQRGSDDTRPHDALLQKNIPIFEGLNLKDVPPGEYQFIGLPLHIPGIDGAPARAILLDTSV